MLGDFAEVKVIWKSWSDDLQAGVKDMKGFGEHFKALEQRVRQHEKDICSLMERRASLQRMAKSGNGELHQRQIEVWKALESIKVRNRKILCLMRELVYIAYSNFKNILLQLAGLGRFVGRGH